MQKEISNKHRILTEQGDAEMQFKLGEYYFDQRSKARSEAEEEQVSKECYKWYFKAAQQGHVLAQRYLGEFHETGICADEDDQQAAMWYQHAAEQGDITAQYRLGDLLMEGGWNLDADKDEAVKWFLRAADQGDADSQFRLGEYYFDTEAIDEAIMWFKKAAAQGNDDARKVLQEISVQFIITRKWNKESKPSKCPHCGSADIKKILYGMPLPEVDLSKYIIGGCVAFDDSPVWGCVNCSAGFGKRYVWHWQKKED